MQQSKRTSFTKLAIPTQDGRFIASYSEKGLAEMNFPSKENAGANSTLKGVTAPVRRWHRMTTAALKRVLAGRAVGVLPPLDLSGTDFQRRVWSALRQINGGKTRGYGEIAKQIGKPKAVRAVGGACGANPIPVLIPCHRVLAANKKLGGFSGGLNWKRTLLAREGITPRG
ncbi:MAG TPA: methylated-DNA--[protein]-cysteine S-methyltransferase [Verrucomicrobiae bacterium]|jgi:O-6-methylguanine DNA methyltransferase